MGDQESGDWMETEVNNQVVKHMGNLVIDSTAPTKDDNMSSAISLTQGLTLGNGNSSAGVARRRKATTSHYVYALMFAGDVKARTTDPKEMERNYRVPWDVVNISEESGQVSVERAGGDGVCIVSPEFAETYCDGKFKSFFESFPKYNCASKGGGTKLDRIKYHKFAETKVELKRLQRTESCRSKKEKIRVHPRQRDLKEKPLPLPLLPIKLEDVASENPIVSEFKEVGLGLSLRSIKRLAPMQELDDDLVDFGIYNAIKELNDVVYVRGSTWSLYFFNQDDPIPQYKQKSMYNIVTKRGSDPNILSKKFMVIPVCRESHWLLVIIANPFPSEHDVASAVERMTEGSAAEVVSKQLYSSWTNRRNGNAPTIFVLDSKFQSIKRSVTNVTAFHDDTVRFIIKGSRYLHQFYWEKLGNGIIVHGETFRWKHGILVTGNVVLKNDIPHYSLDVPEQPNAKDCGLFVITFVKKWFEGVRTHGVNFGKWMIGKNNTNWFDLDTTGRLRWEMFNEIIDRCAKYHPAASLQLRQANPFVNLPIKANL